MADLEEMGFVTSPHTSAGRIPTDKGYRFFVDTLLRQAAADDEPTCSKSCAPARSTAASTAPSRWSPPPRRCCPRVTRLAGVVTVPRPPHQSITQIEFLPLSDNRVLVVLVLNGREVQNRIIQLERHHSPTSCKRAANYLNEQFAGRTLDEVRRTRSCGSCRRRARR